MLDSNEKAGSLSSGDGRLSVQVPFISPLSSQVYLPALAGPKKQIRGMNSEEFILLSCIKLKCVGLSFKRQSYFYLVGAFRIAGVLRVSARLKPRCSNLLRKLQSMPVLLQLSSLQDGISLALTCGVHPSHWHRTECFIRSFPALRGTVKLMVTRQRAGDHQTLANSTSLVDTFTYR